MSIVLLVSILIFILPFCFGMNFLVLARNDADQRIQVNKQKGGLESEDMKESLQLTKLRIYGRNYPPVMIIAKDSQTHRIHYDGLAVEFAEYLAQHFDLILEYVPENASDVTKYGQTEAAINALVNKDVDLVLNGMTPSPERLKLFDMTSPVIYDNFKIMVKWPEEMDRWTAIARPFDTITWSMVAFSLIAFIGMLSLLAFLYGQWSSGITTANDSGATKKSLGGKIMYVIAIITGQGPSTPGRSGLPLRLMLGLWLLMMVVLINSFTGTLTSYMTVPKLKRIPQSLEELAMMKEYRVTIMENYVLAKSFLSAKSGTYKVLGDSLRAHPELLPKDYYKASENVMKLHAANVETSIAIAYRIATDLKLHGKCQMTASNPISHIQSYSAALPKNSPFTQIINRELWRAMETGLVDYWKKKHVPSMDECKLNHRESKGRPKSISFFALSSAFLVFGIGIGFATIAFLLEQILYRPFGRNT